eukprot:gnl/MRDRNA2_/MRDRNA2_105422_c0_seq1.p1 gnl/MRDRNA2_/MRDRNA2_105422_c0~~gnl/MRDRNA2_/MRDRNA2_105422_c0_seq1.p1  ORF type:complete len:242 (-),score=35.97 gnl/MRDRNA2_/MRDRNA2_105422_c0_seq1:320-1045(-)
MVAQLLRNAVGTANTYLRVKHDNVRRASRTCEHSDVWRLDIHIHAAYGLPNIELSGVIDPYAVVTLGSSTTRTTSIQNQCNPEWDEVIVFPLLMAQGDQIPSFTVDIYDDNYTKNTLISSATIQLPEIPNGIGTKTFDRVQNLVTPASGDGGFIKYSLTISSVSNLQQEVDELKVLTHVPFLLLFAKLYLDFRSSTVRIVHLPWIATKWWIRTASHVAFMPFATAKNVTKKILKKLLAFVI